MVNLYLYKIVAVADVVVIVVSIVAQSFLIIGICYATTSLR